MMIAPMLFVTVASGLVFRIARRILAVDEDTGPHEFMMILSNIMCGYNVDSLRVAVGFLMLLHDFSFIYLGAVYPVRTTYVHTFLDACSSCPLIRSL